MSRQASSKPVSGTSQSSTTIGFETGLLGTSRHDCVLCKREVTPQNLSAANHNHYLGEMIDTIGPIRIAPQSTADFVLTISADQARECIVQSASSKPGVKLHGVEGPQDTDHAFVISHMLN